MKKSLLILPALLLLSGCVTQEQVDVKLAKGCAAGLQSLLGDKTIEDVKTTNFSNELAEGGMHRRVTMTVEQKDGWIETEEEYSCLFLEEWGLFKSSHRGLLVQVKIGDDVYGKKDGKIIGNFDDFLALTNVVDAAMGQ